MYCNAEYVYGELPGTTRVIVIGTAGAGVTTVFVDPRKFAQADDQAFAIAVALSKAGAQMRGAA